MDRHQKLKTQRRVRRARHVRRGVRGTPERPRLTVFRSVAQIYVQAVDDVHGVTLAASSTLDKELRGSLDGGKAERARSVGKDLASKLLDKGIETAVFDRGWYRYHGRVRALADGAREGGLKF